MSNLVLRANLSRPLTHNELDANMQFLEIVEWSAKDFRADQFAYVTVTGTTTLYLCLETHTAFVYDNNGGNFAETITVDGTPITFWRKISGSGGGTGAEFVNATFDSGTNIITFTAADGSTVTIDLSSLSGGGTGTSGTSGNSGT
jgi:membrane-bound inhibitor of C-type lysozyme